MVRFIRTEKTNEVLATVNYYVMEEIIKAYPMTAYDEEDIRVLGRLERPVFAKLLREQGLESRDAALAARLCLGVLQNDRYLDYQIDRLSRGSLEPRLRSILRLGAYQLLFLDKVPDHAAVSETVQLCRSVGLDRAAGLVNAVLRDVFGIKESIYFLGDNKYFRGTLIVTDIWKNVGWSSILYLATITGIDPALYEAATVDGASRWQCTRYITIPSLVSTIVVMLILNVGSIMDAGFDQVFNLYNSAVYQSGDIIDTYVYRYGLGDMKYALATAVGLFKNVIAFLLVVGTNLIARRISGEGIW